MNADSPLTLYIRILLASMFIALLGLAPSPRAAGQFLVDAYQFAASGDLLNAAKNLAGASEYYPWRLELDLQAARYAYQAGDPQTAIQYLLRP